MIGAHEGLPYKDFGGEAKSGWMNLDLGGGDAKVDKQGQGQNQAPDPAPAPAATEEPSQGLGDYATDLLDNLPDFNFGN